jgi:hypothetical protein
MLGDFYVYGFPIAISKSEALGSGTSGSAICVSVCLTLLTHVHSIPWESVTYLPFSSFTILVLKLITLLKVIDALIQVYDIFDHTVGFKLIDFSFQMFLLLVPELFTSSTSYIEYYLLLGRSPAC